MHDRTAGQGGDRGCHLLFTERAPKPSCRLLVGQTPEIPRDLAGKEDYGLRPSGW